jgi:phage-related protein
MPKTEVVIFAEDDGCAPLLDWLDSRPEKVRTKIIVRIERLAEQGHELRRPEADYLRDGIYELRIPHRHLNYRVFYFFHEQRAVLSHGTTKEGRVPSTEIDRATDRARMFALDPEGHTYRE